VTAWGTVVPDPGDERHLVIGTTGFRLRHEGDFWSVHVHGPAIASANVSCDRQTVLAPETSRLVLRPATPDLPVVLRPERPIAFLPGTRREYDILLPPWCVLAVDHSGKNGNTSRVLLDVPSRPLKRTWFGNQENGELAWSVHFAPDSRDSPGQQQLIVPLTIENSSHTVLWFERLLVRVVHLDVYRCGERLVTNGVTVNFKGTEQFSQITFAPSPPARFSAVERMAARRLQASSDLIRKSFLWLKDFAV
jgi:hypothetical protein